MKFTIDSLASPLSAIARAANLMPNSSKALWYSRISHVYGDMGGQRSVDITELMGELSKNGSVSSLNAIIALETYYYLIVNVLALAAFNDTPADFIRNIKSISAQKFKTFLRRLISGEEYEVRGIYGMRDSFDFAWLPETLESQDLIGLKNALGHLSKLWKGQNLRIPGIDPFQYIHNSLFHKNLLHITGQFYTPEWLATLLLQDINWSPEERMIDPYCGSGVFLLCALEQARKKGAGYSDVLPNILGIDLNPVACAAARANIALYIGKQHDSITRPVNINILSADSLTPAVINGYYRKSNKNLFGDLINVDGESISLPDLSDIEVVNNTVSGLKSYGLFLDEWVDCPVAARTKIKNFTKPESARERRILEQLAIFLVKPADVVVTNPPWVGWEYMSRPYRKAITDAWCLYDLFKVKGLEASFLKEDLSTLALMAAWDYFLKDSGRSSVVIRPSVMHSDLSSRGLRRLSLSDDGVPLRLEKVRTFPQINVFPGASTETATWAITKAQETSFPVKVLEWKKITRRWNPDSSTKLDEIAGHVQEIEKCVSRTDPRNKESRWIIVETTSLNDLDAVRGSNFYEPRMGVFTGGANGVFYLENIGPTKTKGVSRYRNITARAKRQVPVREIILEDDIVYAVVRGRDIKMWHASPKVFLLCPHTHDTKIYPLNEDLLSKNYPLAYSYLTSMRDILNDRKGFAGWEKKIFQQYFYAMQRIGEYTFSPFKVCWKYIASEFTVCVIEKDSRNKTILPNDKVMFISFNEKYPAYFLAGVLSSSLVRTYINSSVTKRQISTNIIKSLNIPEFDPRNKLHRSIAELCIEGHGLALKNNNNLNDLLSKLDKLVRGLYFD